MSNDFNDDDAILWPIESPAFIINNSVIVNRAIQIAEFANSANTELLYSVKSLPHACALSSVADYVAGYSASSIYETRVVRDVVGWDTNIDYISSVIFNNDLAALCNICNRITANSIDQYAKLHREMADGYNCGLRINPGLSLVKDVRYNPSRPDSRLGVSPTVLADIYGNSNSAELLKGLGGVHFHNNCDSRNLSDMVKTLDLVENELSDLLHRCSWVNIGGGYDICNAKGINRAIDRLLKFGSQYGVELVMEPGSAFNRESGLFIATVVDMISPDSGAQVAILDLSVNHWPEVFEYQFEPDVRGHVEGGAYTYQLAGCSCLAGDIFGTYSFDEPLKVGSRVVFENAGAYSIVKANMFNGINLPTIYTLTESGELVLTKQFTYEDFASRCGVDTNAAIRV
jgi:carboxynorspermidine decarboxylase